MSLFPAYAESSDPGDGAGVEPERWQVETEIMSMATENELLASDSDHEMEDKVPEEPVKQIIQLDNEDFYLDTKLDYGNLRVSTLYWPGRPQYHYNKKVLGDKDYKHKDKVKRYYREKLSDAEEASVQREVSERELQLQRQLAETPDNVALWLHYIHFVESWRGPEAGAEAAGRAERAGARVRGERLRLLRQTLPRTQYIDKLHEIMKDESDPLIRLQLWREVLTAGAAGGEQEQVMQVASAAVRDLKHLPAAYPAVLHTCGSYLQRSGAWEQLVLLIELAVEMNSASPPGPAPRPPPRASSQLQDYEDKVINSGLPNTTVWGRVERTRAGAHWAPEPSGADAALDPQRSPAPADVAPLLMPLHPNADMHLIVTLLRLAKIPLLPSSQHSLDCALAGDSQFHIAEDLLKVVLSARRLPVARRARLAGITRAIRGLVCPPHYFSDDTGFNSWVRWLWETCTVWSKGVIVPWRLRWLHALVLLLDTETEAGRLEAKRIRNECRTILKGLSNSPPGVEALAFVQFARIEASLGGAEGARRAGEHALRHAMSHPDVPIHYALYIARVFGEVMKCVRTTQLCLAHAITGRSLPRSLDSTVDPLVLEEARTQCRARCSNLQSSQAEVSAGARALADALLSTTNEWGVASVLLATPKERVGIMERLVSDCSPLYGESGSSYYEKVGSTLVSCGVGTLTQVRSLAHMFPGNTLLALFAATAASVVVGPVMEMDGLLPAIQAYETDWAPAETRRAVRMLRRVTPSGGALSWAARLAAEAQGGTRLNTAVFAAIDKYPADKWLYVWGASLCGLSELPDAALERGLRVHALPDELIPITVTAHDTRPEN